MSDNARNGQGFIFATDRSEFFALLHVPSGQFMLQTKHNRSYTDQNFPRPEWMSKSYGPRLFVSERGAKQARACWLKGVFERKNVYESEFGGSFRETFDIQPRTDRKPGDLVVVKLRLFVERVIK